jgi:hypothetical protein
MKAYDVAGRFWDAKPCRLGARDRVVVEESAVSYMLWGHEIAKWDRKANVLDVSDCGWQTWLTQDRLNNVLREVGLGIYSDRGRWYVHYSSADKSYHWEGKHRVYIGSGRIEPAKPRVRHTQISERLKVYYKRAQEAIEAKHRTLTLRTLDGTVYVFVGEVFGRRTGTLVVKTHSPEFEAWEGRLNNSTVYSAFSRSDACRLLKELNEKLSRIDDEKAERVLSSLKLMHFKVEDLPKDLASSLAVAMVVEG